MATGIGLVVKIAADTAKAVGDIHDVNKALDGTGSSTSNASKMFSGLKSAALPVIGAVVAGVGAAAAAMVEFGQAALEDQREADKLARVLKTIPGITDDMVASNEDWITTTMYATHVVDSDLREAVGQLALITGDLSLAQEYAARSADLATVANVDYASATDAVEAALGGHTRALMAMAPWLDTNKDGALSLSEAQGILTASTLDGQAAAAAAEDPWTTINLIWGELKESLGQWVLPLMKKLGDWFKDPVNQQKIKEFTDKVSALSTQFGEKLLPYLEEFITWVSSPEGKQQMREWANTAKVIAGAVEDIAKALGWVIEQWSKLPAPLKSVLGISDVLAGLNKTSAGSQSAGGQSVGTFATVPASGVTVNFYGGVHSDPEATARAISSSLRGSERRNAQTRRLEPAW